MSPLRSILVHVDASATCTARLKAALQIAETQDAHVTALYAVMPAMLQNPTAYAIAASPEVAPLLAEYDAERRQKARAVFDAATQGVADGRVSWAEAHDEPTRSVARAALACDLLVLGQREPRHGFDADLPPDFVESVLLWSGKPGLVVPHIGLQATPGSVALVAWKESRESARALAAAIPMLKGARQVHLAVWGEGTERDETGAPDVLGHLQRHGIRATLHRQGGSAQEMRSVGDLMLSLAADLNADLLVMGCYGHGRAREWALGGATRTVLASMTVPVLMSH